MISRFLDKTEHHTLDVTLLALHQRLSNHLPASFDDLDRCIRGIIDSVTGKLVSPNWEASWRHDGWVARGWFGDDEVGRSLHTAFTGMVRLVIDARTPRQQRECAEELAGTLSDYFFLRGYDMPGQEQFLDFPAQQRKLLVALRGKGKVSIDRLLGELYPRSHSPKESLHKLKTRTNKSLAEKATGLEIREEGQTYALVPV